MGRRSDAEGGCVSVRSGRSRRAACGVTGADGHARVPRHDVGAAPDDVQRDAAAGRSRMPPSRR
jgi:hypothetical protein